MLLLDSNILIYALMSDHQPLRDSLRHKEAACSIVSHIEVMGYHKLTSPEKAAFNTLFESIGILPLTSEIATVAISLRQTKKMTLGDAIIAATALVYRAELLTANTKDFDWIKNLNHTNPLI
ncbi:type II toxin-antitoxin system VapC family toxin [Lunatimonas salinarum]|uniref:type II toxin-antitoxin system VapC family toxin n=1 Tax=Lunatimonas salinarum TaxID=1774590 RepID=UPI0024749F6F|nr:type II toxin-antitoxin system VapC family toxin [Lunatimonas salinarum]